MKRFQTLAFNFNLWRYTAVQRAALVHAGVAPRVGRLARGGGLQRLHLALALRVLVGGGGGGDDAVSGGARDGASDTATATAGAAAAATATETATVVVIVPAAAAAAPAIVSAFAGK